MVWYSESGVKPNTIIQFNPKTERFVCASIPSGGGTVRNMAATSDGRFVYFVQRRRQGERRRARSLKTSLHGPPVLLLVRQKALAKRPWRWPWDKPEKKAEITSVPGCFAWGWALRTACRAALHEFWIVALPASFSRSRWAFLRADQGIARSRGALQCFRDVGDCTAGGACILDGAAHLR
jgi:hypothetical protein